MSINPESYSDLARPLVGAAEAVVNQIGEALASSAEILAQDPDNLIAARQVLERRASLEAEGWRRQWQAWADADLADAYMSGIQHTEAELAPLRAAGQALPQPAQRISLSQPLAAGGAGGGVPPVPAPVLQLFDRHPDHLTFYGVFRGAAYEALEGSHLQILRAAQDTFRQLAIDSGSVFYRESDVFTRRQFSQDLLNRYAERGLQTIRYRDGRQVSLDVYAEMVGRTQAGHAAVQAALNRYEEYGYDLVRVSAHFRACPVCVPWEGRILSRSGRSQKYPSLSEATAAGLFHPNCAHDVSPYIPGVSGEQEPLLHPAEQALVQEHGYAGAQRIAYQAQERQREIERHIRAWKRREATALDPAAKQQARAQVRNWQAEQRKHLEANKFLRRKPERERLAKTGTPRPLPQPPGPPRRPAEVTLRMPDGTERRATAAEAGGVRIVRPVDLDTKRQRMTEADLQRYINQVPEQHRDLIREVRLMDSYVQDGRKMNKNAVASFDVKEGHITFWRNERWPAEQLERVMADTMRHEAAHALEERLGDAFRTDWQAAVRREGGHITAYAGTNLNEDVAETVMHYWSPDRMERRQVEIFFPERLAVLRKYGIAAGG